MITKTENLQKLEDKARVKDYVRSLPAFVKSRVKRIWVETKTSMCYWYPKATDPKFKKDTLTMPKTVMLEVNGCDTWLLQRGKFWHFIRRKRYEELCARIKAKANEIGYPVMIRTDMTSHKNDWKNKCVENEAELLDKISELIKYNNKRAEKMHALVFREYIPLYEGFLHPNGRPVTKERRYYVKDGKVICHSERSWISSDRVSIPIEYMPKLEEINAETDGEVNLLTEMAEEFSRRVDGHIAVDFALGQNGKWYLIEANDAITSWHQRKPCEYHPLWHYGSAAELKK